MPELAEASKHIMFEETKDGLDINIVDQEGRSMFPEGSKDPYERTRRIIEKIRPVEGAALSDFDHRAHVSLAKPRPRPITGLGTCRPTGLTRCARFWKSRGCCRTIFMRSPAKPIPTRCSRTTPTSPPYRRVTITLMHEPPPVPPGLMP